jgi:hypothetical protein
MAVLAGSTADQHLCSLAAGIVDMAPHFRYRRIVD